MFSIIHKPSCNLIFFIIAAVLMISDLAVADARTDYLLNMLKKATNYRLRVQAATTLGKLRAKEAVPDLVKATQDDNELVVISAAIALKQIGDPSVIEEISKSLEKTSSKAAKSQLRITLQVLKSIGSGGAQVVATTPGKPRYLIRIDAMGNSSKERQKGLAEIMRRHVVNRMRQEGDVVVQDPGMSESEVKRKLKKEKLVGFIVSGSIIRLDREGNRLSVKLGLNVFSNPDYNLLMMPTTEAAVRLGPSKVPGEVDKKEIENAIGTVADSLITDIFRNLRQMGPQ